MEEDGFLSGMVREMFLEVERTRTEQIERIMKEDGLARDSAELEFYRRFREKEKGILQRAITKSEFFERFGTGNFEFDGYVLEDDDLTKLVYTHIKKANVDGVQASIWAEDDEWESYDCLSPETVECYKITIQDYSHENKGITFAIRLTPDWTKEKIMHEFDDIVESVRNRIGFGYFEAVYGNTNDVIWGGAIDIDDIQPEE